MLPLFLTRRVSSFLALSIIIILAFIAGSWTIWQAQKLKKIQELPSWYRDL